MANELFIFKGAVIKNEICRKIWDMIIPEPSLSESWSYPTILSKQFIQCPGGIGEVHHNYIGGLLEHCYGMIRTAETVINYTGLDKDIVLTGCLLHDIGKVDTYDYKIVMEMTDTGRLLHHTIIGFGILKTIAETDFKIPIPFTNNDETMLKLAHIIISHHEDEGLRKPMFPEAQAVAALDSMDAAVQHAVMFSTKPENQDPESNWTTFCRLTERQYFVPRKVQEVIPEPEPKKGTIVIDSMF
jgi:3'-5' exoribonuclease